MKTKPHEDLPSLDALAPANAEPRAFRSQWVSLVERLRLASRLHPAPALAWIETVFWLFAIASLFDHLLNRNGAVASGIWWLTIGPHEIGHLICTPFGTLLMFFGGTFWQIAFWAIIGAAEFILRRRLRVLLLCMVIVGHSFVNAAVYIGDARARDLPLLFGMSSDHHDWYNILNMLGLLPLDGGLALFARLAGSLIVVGAALTGIYFAWVRGAKTEL